MKSAFVVALLTGCLFACLDADMSGGPGYTISDNILETVFGVMRCFVGFVIRFFSIFVNTKIFFRY